MKTDVQSMIKKTWKVFISKTIDVLAAMLFERKKRQKKKKKAWLEND